MRLRYIVPSRIAINLYDMNGDLGRVDGGMGFSLEYPKLVFESFNSGDINIYNKANMSFEMIKEIKNSIQTLKEKFNFENNITINIEESIPEHCGFGSKTATLLSIGHAYCKLNNHEISFKKLGGILRRGGTSGLGINLIKTGGFILEGGHSTKDKKLFQPSSSVKKVLAAPVLAKYEPNWGVLLILPRYERVFGEKERNFFSTICPIDKEDIEKLARITLSKLLPSVAENDLKGFCEGINLIQERTWKKSEIELYGKSIKELMKEIKSRNPSLGVGMSSIGPVIYVFGEDIQKVYEMFKEKDLEMIKVTKINNSGVEINILEE